MLLGACSEVDFKTQYSYREGEFFVGQVDILFVIDNSGSMSVEHRKIANRFSNYINTLDSSGLDYRIAMITTDVSYSYGNNEEKEANGYGAYQDGELLTFDHGDVVITEDDHDRVRLFADLIRRRETLNCENSDFAKSECPSIDERGIYAAHLAVSRKDSDFFRENSHLAVVFLSDEDERSTGGRQSDAIDLPYPSWYNIEEKDKPENLIKAVKNSFHREKSFSVYSIVIKPGDQACLNKQRDQGENHSGEYGKLYAQLAQPSTELKELGNIMPGFLGSICSKDYGSELSSMGQKVAEASSQIVLECDPLEPSSESRSAYDDEDGGQEVVPLTITYEPVPSPLPTHSVDSDNILTFRNLPPGTKVIYEYTCPLKSQ